MGTMNNNRKIYFLFTQTPLHVGAGESVGYVDLPIQREAHTRIPIVPGSSLKGVLRDEFSDPDLRVKLFGHEPGEQDQNKFRAGALLIGEARVLAFPVRSAKGAFAWITCPLALKRAQRDHVLTNAGEYTLSDKQVAVASESIVIQHEGKKRVVLEEYTFDVIPHTTVSQLGNELANLLSDDVWKMVKDRLVVVSDGVFSYFVQSGCPIEQHVKINDETGTAAEGALYNEEVVPSETLFYGVIAAQDVGGNGRVTAEEALREIDRLNGRALQIGAGETTGLGWCTFAFKK